MLNLRTQPKTTLDEIMLTICSLSYLGDIRTQGFEDTQKVNKIFEGSYEHLKKLYEPVMKDCSWLEYSSDGTIYQVNKQNCSNFMYQQVLCCLF